MCLPCPDPPPQGTRRCAMRGPLDTDVASTPICAGARSVCRKRRSHSTHNSHNHPYSQPLCGRNYGAHRAVSRLTEAGRSTTLARATERPAEVDDRRDQSVLPTLIRLTLSALELKIAAGCALVVLALTERVVTLMGLVRSVQSGSLSQEAAYRRYMRSNRRSSSVVGAAVVIVAAFVFNPPLLGVIDDLLQQLGLQVCAYVPAYVVPMALFTVLNEWLVYPTLRRELRPRAPATGVHFIYVLKLFLLQQMPTALLLEAVGALNVFALYGYRWVVPAGAALLALGQALMAKWLYSWGKREVPIERTEWADLKPRIQGWAALAGVRLAAVRVEYLGETGLANAAVAGMWRHTLFLGADLLAHTDWRQRDAVIGHELGHIGLGHMRKNAAVSVLKATLAAGGFAYLDIKGIGVDLARMLHPDFAPSLDVRYGPASALHFLGVALAALWVAVYVLDRWRRHGNELACDRFSVGLAGDPLAKAVALMTIHKVSGTPPTTRSYTHPSTGQRIRTLLWMLRNPAHFAPWAYQAVPSVVNFAEMGRALTIPLASSPPIEPLPPAPWSRMPEAPASFAGALPALPLATMPAAPPLADASAT